MRKMLGFVLTIVLSLSFFSEKLTAKDVYDANGIKLGSAIFYQILDENTGNTIPDPDNKLAFLSTRKEFWINIDLDGKMKMYNTLFFSKEESRGRVYVYFNTNGIDNFSSKHNSFISTKVVYSEKLNKFFVPQFVQYKNKNGGTSYKLKVIPKLSSIRSCESNSILFVDGVGIKNDYSVNNGECDEYQRSEESIFGSDNLCFEMREISRSELGLPEDWDGPLEIR